MPLLIGNMELGAGPSGETTEKYKGNKIGRAPHGKEDKDRMKYQFQGELLHSKVIIDWKEITNTNIRHINIDEFKQRVRINPKTENARLIKCSKIAKATGFPPSLFTLELVMACRATY